jgi:large subunit ribosomal protein L21
MSQFIRLVRPLVECSYNRTNGYIFLQRNPIRTIIASSRVQQPEAQQRLPQQPQTQQQQQQQKHLDRTISYAAVHHGEAYEAAMSGPHGKQLALAKLEGLGKDDPAFDPFLEEELEEARLKASLSGNTAASAVEPIIESSKGEEEDDDDIIDWRAIYNNDGSLKRSKAEKATLRAGAPSGGLFAVIELAGSQHKITTDDVLIVNRLKPLSDYKIGSIHTFSENVMLLGSSHFTLVGMPYVMGAQVDIMIEEITKDAKIIVFSKRRRKNSKRTNGFRRDVTMLRILDIRLPDSYINAGYRERPEPTPPPQIESTGKRIQHKIAASSSST